MLPDRLMVARLCWAGEDSGVKEDKGELIVLSSPSHSLLVKVYSTTHLAHGYLEDLLHIH